jgi:uncharacterized protein (TIGR03083 family)
VTGTPDLYDTQVRVLRSSVDHLRSIAAPLDDAEILARAYADEWSIADELSHLGSGAEIMLRSIDDASAGKTTPDDFHQGVWDRWNAKLPRAKVDDALESDGALGARFESLLGTDWSALQFPMGPLHLDLSQLIGLRCNEHALHTWDVEVALDPAAILASDAVALVIDNLELIGRFTAKPTGEASTVSVSTTAPTRGFTIALRPDAVVFTAGDLSAPGDVELPAEAFIRLVYGRLDPAHTPEISRGAELLAELRKVFPGP